MSLRTTVKDATRAVSKAFNGEDAVDDDILDTLKKEHEEVADLLDKLEKSESAPQRRSLVLQIRKALIPHVKAEQTVVYDAVIALKAKDAKIDGHEGYIEHELASRTLDQLGKIKNAASPEHKAAGKVLRELITHHVEEEERNIWKDVKENFSDDDRAAMNSAFLAAKKKVKV